MKHKEEFIHALNLLLTDEPFKAIFNMENWKSCLFGYYNYTYATMPAFKIFFMSVKEYFELNVDDAYNIFVGDEGDNPTNAEYHVNRVLTYIKEHNL